MAKFMKLLNKNYQAIIFDFDGVLADSVNVKTNAFAALFEKYGKDIQQKVIDHHRSHGGMTRVEKFKHYYKEFLKKSVDDKGLKLLCDRFSLLVVDKVVDAPEIPGAEDFLKLCCDNSILCFVNSATPNIEIRKIVQRRGLDEYFKEVLGSSMSKTENLVLILEMYSLDKKYSLFFGDASSDYEAATASGVDFVGILPNKNAPLLKMAPEIRWARNFVELVL